MRIQKINRLLTICMMLIGMHSFAQDANRSVQAETLRTVSSVADKLIRDTRFSFKKVMQKEELGMQVIDFREQLMHPGQLAYATRKLTSLSDTIVNFGINAAGFVTISIDDREIFRQNSNQFTAPVEEAYDRFRFTKKFIAHLSKGKHDVLIRYISREPAAVVFLRPIHENGELDPLVKFDSSWQSSWWLLGPFAAKDTTLITGAANLKTFYNKAGKIYNWERMPAHVLPELLIDSSLTYQRDPYADWNYSNGNTIWSLLPLAAVSGDKRYWSFVKNYTDFIISNRDYFAHQYDSLFIFRGSFHRLFRLTMLDDAGSAVLPFIELGLTDKDPALKKIIDPVAAYILHKQVRLPDGTYCRPEPEKYTVWADDLFMSVPFLLRLAKTTHQQQYSDSAAQQFLRFRKYLLNTKNGLYQHGWYSATNQQAPVAWGRANGWIAWATAELLSWLPANHPAYATILASFREQVAVLAGLQEKDGMWHQVLNNPASYKETSCTAMFTLVMARGVREGWIDKKYSDNALRGWAAVQSKIDKDGTVHGICRGTEIGPDEKFYFDRKTFDQDPRGLGAVITAGVEISKMK